MNRRRFNQKADRHPRPAAIIPLSLFGDIPFAGHSEREYALVGRLAHIWADCVHRKTSRAFGFRKLISDDAWDLLVSEGYIVERDGELHFTGPTRDPNWLCDVRREWWTYAIEMTGHGRVKIGRSIDVARRLEGLQTSSPAPLRLIGRRKGDHELEIHADLRQWRLTGEWFSLNSDSLAVLSLHFRFLRTL